MPKVMIVNGNPQYERMFKERGWNLCHTVENADLIQFTGGSDVSPYLYGEEVHRKSMTNKDRDLQEKGIYERAVVRDIPMAGICRGSQFLHVMNGGRLYQHVDNHAISGTHKVVDIPTDEIFEVTSTHHQMMRDESVGDLIAFCKRSGIKESMAEGGIIRTEKTPGDDIEAMFYPLSNSLSFQPHPEFRKGGCQDYYFLLLSRYLGFEVRYDS